ncbi:hypothetical protein EMCG_00239 [[Emmonsia] crescens]|uniref:Uncharacterized protein n=1 Tax=[Emmonsia] crescens TaxID=73230 RepID=A0A0G2J9K3_9EURO|nr:hypothetical protein EMCG_00239 [Emmonsia crescens UAMH 3008]
MTPDHYQVLVTPAFIRDGLNREQIAKCKIEDLECLLRQTEASNSQERMAHTQLLELYRQLQRDLCEMTLAKSALEKRLVEANQFLNNQRAQYETSILMLKSETKAHHITINNVEEETLLTLKSEIEVHFSTLEFLKNISADID